ncbi:hypothetical protein [Bdellovibrio sp.]|uniref:hypothetical protein n=1 Tax=Bdellovibrio sp. TaxID=28201 RepID=UPI0039E5BE1C
MDRVHWADVNTSTAERIFGKPDIREYADSERREDAWVYLGGEPKTTRLSLIFNAHTGTLLSANWFFRATDSEANLESLAKRYSHLKFDLEHPYENGDVRGPKMLFYSSKDGGVEIAVYKRSKVVSSLSWEIAPSLAPEKRKPTSH